MDPQDIPLLDAKEIDITIGFLADENGTVVKKRRRRVSFAQTQTVHYFPRNEEFDTPPESTNGAILTVVSSQHLRKSPRLQAKAKASSDKFTSSPSSSFHAADLGKAESEQALSDMDTSGSQGSWVMEGSASQRESFDALVEQDSAGPVHLWHISHDGEDNSVVNEDMTLDAATFSLHLSRVLATSTEERTYYVQEKEESGPVEILAPAASGNTVYSSPENEMSLTVIAPPWQPSNSDLSNLDENPSDMSMVTQYLKHKLLQSDKPSPKKIGLQRSPDLVKHSKHSGSPISPSQVKEKRSLSLLHVDKENLPPQKNLPGGLSDTLTPMRSDSGIVMCLGNTATESLQDCWKEPVKRADALVDVDGNGCTSRKSWSIISNNVQEATLSESKGGTTVVVPRLSDILAAEEASLDDTLSRSSRGEFSPTHGTSSIQAVAETNDVKEVLPGSINAPPRLESSDRSGGSCSSVSSMEIDGADSRPVMSIGKEQLSGDSLDQEINGGDTSICVVELTPVKTSTSHRLLRLGLQQGVECGDTCVNAVELTPVETRDDTTGHSTTKNQQWVEKMWNGHHDKKGFPKALLVPGKQDSALKSLQKRDTYLRPAKKFSVGLVQAVNTGRFSVDEILHLMEDTIQNTREFQHGEGDVIAPSFPVKLQTLRECLHFTCIARPQIELLQEYLEELKVKVEDIKVKNAKIKASNFYTHKLNHEHMHELQTMFKDMFRLANKEWLMGRLKHNKEKLVYLQQNKDALNKESEAVKDELQDLTILSEDAIHLHSKIPMSNSIASSFSTKVPTQALDASTTAFQEEIKQLRRYVEDMKFSQSEILARRQRECQEASERLILTKGRMNAIQSKIHELILSYKNKLQSRDGEEGNNASIQMLEALVGETTLKNNLLQEQQVMRIQLRKSVLQKKLIEFNYRDMFSQRLQFEGGSVSKVKISRCLGSQAIDTAFPFMEATLAFQTMQTTLENIDRIQVSNIQQLVQRTNWLVGTLVDILKEIQHCCQVFGVRTKFSLLCDGELQLHVTFLECVLELKVILAFKMSCIKSGDYPEDLTPYNVEVYSVGRLFSFVLTVEDLNARISKLGPGFGRLASVCSCVYETIKEVKENQAR